jgi:hypothetical protein
MKAYDIAMVWIFICCSFPILDAMGITGFSEYSSVFNSLSWLTNPIFTIPGIGLGVTGIIALAIAMALATIVVLNSNFVTDRGMAMGVFALIFWGSFSTAMLVMSKIPFPGIEIFYTIFFLASTLIFIIGLIQMPIGGMQGHV